jgi:hypothetical protein
LEKIRTLVLGGGLIGSWAAYKLGAKLLTLKPDKVNPYIFLHNAAENRELLSELGVSYDIKDWRIGFFWHNDIHKSSTKAMVSEYHEKVYGHPPNKPQFTSSSYSVLTPNYYEVRDKLAEKVKDVLYDKIVEVDILKKQVTLEHGSSFEYDKLVNTLPLRDLYAMMGRPDTNAFESKPLYFYKLPYWPKQFSYYDTVQVMDGGDERTRFIRGSQPNTFFLETIAADYKYGELAVYLKYGKILNSGWHLSLRDNALKRLEQYDILSVGRFARWTQHYDTEDALFDLNEYIRRRQLVASKNRESLLTGKP